MAPRKYSFFHIFKTQNQKGFVQSHVRKLVTTRIVIAKTAKIYIRDGISITYKPTKLLARKEKIST